jgi:hypothetical protein
MTNFANFKLGENIAELSSGLIPEMADLFEVPIGASPSPVELGQLVGAIGSKKTLQDNLAGAKAWMSETTGSEQAASDLAVNWLDRAGVQEGLNRSIWTPELSTPIDATIVIAGAVANWQDRVAKLVADKTPKKVYIPIGNREMNTGTEIINDNVIAFQASEGRFPTEAEYATRFVEPLLNGAGFDTTLKGYETANGQEIADRFVNDYRKLFQGAITFARTANAGIQLTGQFRSAALNAGIAFDIDRTSPQAYVLTDEFPVARTADQQKNPKEFQNPFTAIRQIAVTAKTLKEAQS